MAEHRANRSMEESKRSLTLERWEWAKKQSASEAIQIALLQAVASVDDRDAAICKGETKLRFEMDALAAELNKPKEEEASGPAETPELAKRESDRPDTPAPTAAPAVAAAPAAAAPEPVPEDSSAEETGAPEPVETLPDDKEEPA